MGAIRLKRVYEPAGDDDGLRVLVDRIWPRGLSRAEVDFDLWMKEVAPSPPLRRWFGHRPERWPEFRRRYCEELARSDAAERLREMAARGDITLLYAARDEEHNHALVLASDLRRHRPRH